MVQRTKPAGQSLKQSITKVFPDTPILVLSQKTSHEGINRLDRHSPTLSLNALNVRAVSHCNHDNGGFVGVSHRQTI